MQLSSLHPSYHIESLARGLAVLSEFSEEKPTLSLTDVAHRLQLNKTTTLRLLSTLESLGYLERDRQTKLYRPGLEVLRLGFVVLNALEVRQVAAPYLRQLVNEVEETVNLAVLDNSEMVYIDRIGSKHLVNVYRPVGSRLPAYCTSTGKAILAFLPAEQLEAVLNTSTWERYTEHTITTPEALHENLALVRQRGFADSDGEMIPELRDVSAPIRQHDGQIVAAVNISVPSHRVSYEKLISELGSKVVDTGRKISEALGYNVKRVP
ncbi:MAG: IclR family transcriptional regulator [Anaerolineae bacterium]|nr:IclR family transcriptional regulator [Anaerolineae bacterium]